MIDQKFATEGPFAQKIGEIDSRSSRYVSLKLAIHGNSLLERVLEQLDKLFDILQITFGAAVGFLGVDCLVLDNLVAGTILVCVNLKLSLDLVKSNLQA